MEILKLVIAGLFSGGFFAFLQFMINRKDSTNERLSKIESKLQKAERDSVRTQMLMMMNHYPDEVSEIMKLAEYYFVTLNGDWYMTGIFNRWLEKNNIGKPTWFKNRD